MPGFMERAVQGAYAFWHTFRDPGGRERRLTREAQSQEYARLWHYYRGHSAAVYRDDYIRRKGLYWYTRLVYNPYPAIVDFYVDNTFDVSREPVDEGLTAVSALNEETDEKLKIAVAQLEQWGNWQSEAPRMVRFGAVAGSVLVKVVDELEREKVTEEIFWPSMVKDKILDATGNVKSYALEYKVYDAEAKEEYTYREEADDDEFRYFRGGKPFRPPQRVEGDETEQKIGVYLNPYGFCPAVWTKHEDDGWDDGTPAVPDTTKIDEINSVTSHARDHGHKAIEGGKLISTDGIIMAVTNAIGQSDPQRSGGLSLYDPRFDWTVLKAPKDSTVSDLGSSYDLTQLDPEIKRMVDSFERDYPELQVSEIVKNKAQISGVALERMLAPAQKKLDRAAARYHHQTVKLRQMQMAIAGWRYNGNGWTKKDSQQQRFSGFNLESYSAGSLDFGFKRSQLIQMSEFEEEELKKAKADRAVALKDHVDAVEFLIVAGYTKEEAAVIAGRRAKEVEQRQKDMAKLMPQSPSGLNGQSEAVN
jgi:hypothetical protein